MARPRKDATERRSAPVLVKLTTAERDQLAGEAVRLRVSSVTALVRERALSGTVTLQQGEALAAEDRIALQRIGVNLNQIARRLNEQGPAAAPAIGPELERALARLNALLVKGTQRGPEPF